MNELTNDVTGLTLEQLGSEVRILTRQAKQMVLGYGVEIGRRLSAAKAQIPYGQWGDWVAAETEFSQATATRFMRLYQEYGSRQVGFFGAEVESSTLQNLSVSNALRLLAVPEEDRESVAQELDAEHVSARELEAAIKEREALKRELAEVAENRDGLVEQLHGAHMATKETEAALDQAIELYNKAKAEAEELRNRPVEVAVEVDEAAVKKAAAEAREKAEKKAAGEIKALEERLKLAEQQRAAAETELGKAKDAGAVASEDALKAAEAARAEAETLRKQLTAAQSGAGEAILYCRTAQENFLLAVDKVAAMQETHPEQAEKLLAGLERILAAMGNKLREAGALRREATCQD